MTDLVTILPPNSDLFERGLDLAFARLLERIEPPFPELMNPQTTPVDFLPYLAADRGVLGWSATASEASKRNAVQASWPTKQLAGTEKGLRIALEATGFKPTFVPWYQVGAAPYTLVVVATSESNQTAEDYQNLGYRLEDAKAERDAITIKVEKTIPLEQRLRLAQFTRQATRSVLHPYIGEVLPEVGGLAIGAVVRTATRLRVSTFSAVLTPAAQQFFGGVVRTATRIRIEASNG